MNEVKHGNRNSRAQSEALFDALVIVNRLKSVADGATIGEIHAFAYLACLLSLFERSPAVAWGYPFTALPPTLPYAPAITDAVDALELAGFAVRQGDLYVLTESGAVECSIWMDLRQLAWRRRYIDGATGASLVVGVPAVTSDLGNEPQLQRAAILGRPGELLDEATLAPLFEQFAALRQAVGEDAQDLLTPAAIYLTFLASESQVSAAT